jgi:hypothetical protein
LLLALVAAAPADARSPVTLCQSHGRPLAASAQVRVYERHGNVVACSLENGRRIFLGNHWSGGSSGVARVRPLVVAGRFVAWHGFECVPFEGCQRPYFGVVDVRKSRRLTPKLRKYPQVTDMALAPSGSAAWVERAGETETLHRLDPNGRAVIAEAKAIRGLALSERSTLYWTQDGLRRSAPLEPTGEWHAATQERPACGSRGGTLAANAWVRVWSDEGVHRGCSLETRRSFEFGEPYSSSGGTVNYGPYAVAGRVVAWYSSLCSGGQTQSDPFSCEHEINLLDLRTQEPRVLAHLSGTQQASDLVLRRNGSAAWIDGAGVRVVDSGGQRVIGPGQSLALSRGSTLYWTAPDGAVMSAPLR